MRLKDRGKLTSTPLSSDEALYEISSIKESINMNILLVKESSIDCALHGKADDTEQLKCFTFGDIDPQKFIFKPSIHEEEEIT